MEDGQAVRTVKGYTRNCCETTPGSVLDEKFLNAGIAARELMRVFRELAARQDGGQRSGNSNPTKPGT